MRSAPASISAGPSLVTFRQLVLILPEENNSTFVPYISQFCTWWIPRSKLFMKIIFPTNDNTLKSSLLVRSWKRTGNEINNLTKLLARFNCFEVSSRTSLTREPIVTENVKLENRRTWRLNLTQQPWSRRRRNRRQTNNLWVSVVAVKLANIRYCFQFWSCPAKTLDNLVTFRSVVFSSGDTRCWRTTRSDGPWNASTALSLQSFNKGVPSFKL